MFKFLNLLTTLMVSAGTTVTVGGIHFTIKKQHKISDTSSLINDSQKFNDKKTLTINNQNTILDAEKKLNTTKEEKEVMEKVQKILDSTNNQTMQDWNNWTNTSEIVERRIKNLNQQKQRIDGSVSEKKDNYDKQNNIVEKLEKEITDMNRTIVSNQANLNNMEKAKNIAEQNLSQHENKIQNSVKVINQLTDLIDILKKQQTQKESSVTTQQSQVDGYKNVIDSTTQEIKSKISDLITKFNGELSDLNIKIKALDNEIKTLKDPTLQTKKDLKQQQERTRENKQTQINLLTPYKTNESLYTTSNFSSLTIDQSIKDDVATLEKNKENHTSSSAILKTWKSEKDNLQNKISEEEAKLSSEKTKKSQLDNEKVEKEQSKTTATDNYDSNNKALTTLKADLKTKQLNLTTHKKDLLIKKTEYEKTLEKQKQLQKNIDEEMIRNQELTNKTKLLTEKLKEQADEKDKQDEELLKKQKDIEEKQKNLIIQKQH